MIRLAYIWLHMSTILNFQLWHWLCRAETSLPANEKHIRDYRHFVPKDYFEHFFHMQIT